jgi:RNA polymerase sigma-70 factor (ECF subfamily)
LSSIPTRDASPEPDSVTELLAQVSKGNREAESRLIAQVYGELRRLAANCMRRERADHSLQPTALVNEAFMRLAYSPGIDWRGRAHFFAVAGQVMRRILVDHARARIAEKRGGGVTRVTFTEGIASVADRTWEVLAIHEAMERLEKLDARQSRLVELRFFAGMSFDEIALVMNVSGRTVRRDWTTARAWLHTQLKS